MIGWYLNRFRTIPFAEYPYRFFQLLQKKYEKYFCTGIVPKKINCQGINNSPGFFVDIDYLFPGSINIFGKSFEYTNQDINWQKDIFSGNCFPLIFSKEINIRNNPDLSAKNVWEVNRLQFLPHICSNYKKTGDENYLNLFIRLNRSWIEDNPYLRGVNWYSNIEINIRLINWYICWEILEAEELCNEQADFNNFVKTKWLPAIYQHCSFSRKNPSKFSSSNNHLIAEYSGLFVASSLWKFKESEKWMLYARNGLETEILKQHSSGINREEAAEYIQFITDFFLLPFLIGEKINAPFSESYKIILKEIFLYIRNFLDCKGHFPKYGDEDDGRCFIFDTDEKFNNFSSLLISAAIIFKDPQFKTHSAGLDYKNRFLFGHKGQDLYDSMSFDGPLTSSKFYTDQGHFIFRKASGSSEIYLHFDAAPLGFLSIAAHGHADALSFLLHIDGDQIFADPGTYTYHSEPEWRKYFIGTLAHNTVRINKHDQALNGGPTLWLNHFRTEVLDTFASHDRESVRATHTGFRKDKVTHIREIIFNRTINEFEINDTLILTKGNAVQVEIPFHLHPLVQLDKKDQNNYLLSVKTDRSTEFTVDSKLNHVVINGMVSPEILGWYSDSFCNKTPTNVIFCSTRISETTTFKFLIKIL